MNKTITITVIALVAVAMVMSTVAPALASQIQEDRQRPGIHINPNLAFSDGCGLVKVGFVCIALDRDGDRVCDGPSFEIPREAARAAGVVRICSDPTV